MEKEDEILAALLEEEEDCVPTFQEELITGYMRSLERDLIGVDSDMILPPSCSNCYLQSDSAHSVTSSSCLVSDSDEHVLNGIGCECGCVEEEEEQMNELGYLMEASDEELGLSPHVSSQGEMDLCGEEMVDFEPLDLLSGEIEWVPFL